MSWAARAGTPLKLLGSKHKGRHPAGAEMAPSQINNAEDCKQVVEFFKVGVPSCCHAWVCAACTSVGLVLMASVCHHGAGALQTAAQGNLITIKDHVEELQERLAKVEYQKQLLVCDLLKVRPPTRRVHGGDDDTGVACISSFCQEGLQASCR